MRNRPNPAESLVQLSRHDDHAARQASWRQAIAALAQSAGRLGPPPLDGVDERVLESSAHIAIETGLADDLDWIAPGSAAVALYELSSCLPAGQIKRDLRRRVFSRLYEGTASTFATVASRMALGTAKPLESPTLRARVALCFDLPAGSSVEVAPLALALATRFELREAWLNQPSTQALPARRLAAQLLEHAAREAVVRHQLGDAHPLALLRGEDLKPVFRRLLGDREPLVWRHAAVARGLLASVHSPTREEVVAALDPSLSPTEWRRAAVSLVASLVDNDDETLSSCRAIVDSELTSRDPGLIATMLLGLPRVVEAEPDRAEELLDRLAMTRRADVGEAVAQLFSEIALPGFGVGAAAVLRDALAERARTDTPLGRALSARALRQLGTGMIDESSISYQVRAALSAFEQDGAKRAYDLATAAISEAHQVAAFIETLEPSDQAGLPQALAALQDIDAGAVERPTLANLLLLGRRAGETDTNVQPMERLYNRLSQWVIDGARKAGSGEYTRDGAASDQRRLRVLLHLVDAESAARESESHPLKTRLRRAIGVLLDRLARGPDATVHRLLCAALARTFDAAVREGVAQSSDLALVVSSKLDDGYSIATIAEASTNPDVAGPMGALAAFMQPELHEAGEQADTFTDGRVDGALLRRAEIEDLLRTTRRLVRLSEGLSGGGGYRSEALRRVVFRLGRALEAVALARGQTELVDQNGQGRVVIDELEAAIDAFVELTRGARRRVLESVGETHDIDVTTDSPPLSSLLERSVRSGVPANEDQIVHSAHELVAPLPGFLGRVVAQVLTRISTLPTSPGSDVFAVPLEKRRAPLPGWLLPRRTIGSFYVVRPLGSGGVSSVFLVRRNEERNDPKSESFALKVPEYDPTTARSLSEQEFLQLFREEAGALLALPAHPNLARFVTFDLSARPKPILVMELISGASLERLLRAGSLTTELAFRYLDGILAGLEAMHGVGVGHLDVKPSNVILRDGNTPVLVDFGLSGRHLRPGCGTLEYTAPEVLGVVPDGATTTAPPADLYAFGCMAYELLTGEALFESEDELTLVAAHVSHDGWPDKLAQLGEHPTYSRFARALGMCLRRDPRMRPSVGELRRILAQEAPRVSQATWPLRHTVHSQTA